MIIKVILILLLLSNNIISHICYGLLNKLLLNSPNIVDTLWSTSLPHRAIYGNYSLALTRSLKVPTPSYVQILNDDMLSVTSFSLLRKGSIMQFDLDDPSVNRKLNGDYLWPNELAVFHNKEGKKVLLVPDGFLLPGQNDGGLYAILDPHSPDAQPIRITNPNKGWFYHRAVHVVLPGGKQGILTARAKKPILGPGRGELVWISIPDDFGISSLENSQWVETILVDGPDVMFEVVDLDKNDDVIEVVAAHFFGEKLSVHSMRAIDKYPYIEISETATLDTIGRPYGLCLANMGELGIVSNSINSNSINSNSIISNSNSNSNRNNRIRETSTHLLVSTHECSYDIPSAIDMAISAIGGDYPRVRTGRFNGVRGGERLPVENGNRAQMVEKGGSLFAYELPLSSSMFKKKTRTYSNNRLDWKRHTLFRGFKVRGWGGIFAPGAPGFPYVFNMPDRPSSAPMILLAGDCTGSAYLFAPSSNEKKQNKDDDTLPTYDLVFEVECGATVGSAAINPLKGIIFHINKFILLLLLLDGSGDVEIFVPSYELNRVHVFRLSSDNEKSIHEQNIIINKNVNNNNIIKNDNIFVANNNNNNDDINILQKGLKIMRNALLSLQLKFTSTNSNYNNF
jgi:hypothetical protein